MTSTALLIMDVQESVVGRFADDESYLPRLATAVRAARDAGIGVIYVTVAFRQGYPEVSRKNKTFAAMVGSAGGPTSSPSPTGRRA